jgi:hypothetical protein
MENGEYYLGPHSTERVLRLTDELEQLLERYLETIPEHQAHEALAEFATPRSQQVDELLRRVELDGRKTEPAELARSLKDHFEAVESGRYAESAASAERTKWRKRTASDIHRMVGSDVHERVQSYVRQVASEDEATHAFDDDHESTIKGVPPGNSQPIGVDRKYRRR